VRHLPNTICQKSFSSCFCKRKIATILLKLTPKGRSCLFHTEQEKIGMKNSEFATKTNLLFLFQSFDLFLSWNILGLTSIFETQNLKMYWKKSIDSFFISITFLSSFLSINYEHLAHINTN